jgi:hypothetical protein
VQRQAGKDCWGGQEQGKGRSDHVQFCIVTPLSPLVPAHPEDRPWPSGSAVPDECIVFYIPDMEGKKSS